MEVDAMKGLAGGEGLGEVWCAWDEEVVAGGQDEGSGGEVGGVAGRE